MANMEFCWKTMLLIGVLVAARLATGTEPVPASAEPEADVPMLTLNSAVLRSALGDAGVAWRIPDFRLKVEYPVWGPLTAAEMESRVRAVEFRLPMPGVWVGYETPADGERPRATFSIQRGF